MKTTKREKNLHIITTVFLILTVFSVSEIVHNTFLETKTQVLYQETKLQAMEKPITLSGTRLQVAEQLISVFENGTTQIQYGFAKNIGDGSGFTCGRAGFCTGTRDVLEVVQKYTDLKPDNRMAKYIPELKRLGKVKGINGETRGLTKVGDFCKDWEKSAEDPDFCQQQDIVFYEWYFWPARDKAKELGAKLPLTTAVLFDTCIQHGDGNDLRSMSGMAEATNKKMGGSPADGVDEKLWIKEFIQLREGILASSGWPAAVYRTNIFMEIYNAHNFYLDKKIVIENKNFAGTVIDYNEIRND